MKYPKVSVVITTFDRPEMLRETIGCVLGQDFRDFEVVVVDDGSHTAKDALEDFGPRFKEVGISLRVLDLEENTGTQSAPNNIAFQYCHGSYIAQGDDDDLWHEDHLSTLVDAIEREAVDLVYSRWVNRNSDESRGGPSDGSKFPHVPFNWLTANLLFLGPKTNFIKTDTVWSKASVFTALGSKPWNENLRKFVDWDFAKRLAWAGARFFGVDKATLDYRWGHPQIQLDRKVFENTASVVKSKPPAWDAKKVLK